MPTRHGSGARGGLSIPMVQQILGRSTLAMTHRFGHISPEHAMKAVDSVQLGGKTDEVEEGVVPFVVLSAGRWRRGRFTNLQPATNGDDDAGE